MEFTGLTSASHMSLQEAGYGSEEGQLGSEISGAVSGVTTPGASRLQASQSQQRSTTMQRLQQVESDHKDPSGYPRLPKAAVWGRVPTGPSLGAPCPCPRRESRVLKPNELLHKGSGIKAVFSLAPLPRRPCMGESPCTLGGSVDSSNHQFPRQTDRGQDTVGRHPTASASVSR